MQQSEWIEKLTLGANQIGLELAHETAQKAWQWTTLLQQWAGRVNVTTVESPDEILEKHFLDSWLVHSFLPEGAQLLDVGSGAGFPGLALALVRPDLEIVSIETRHKKRVFQRQVRRDLALHNTEIFEGRAQDFPAARRRPTNAVCFRAVGSVETCLELGVPLLGTGGSLLLLKGPNVADELVAAQAACASQGIRAETREFQLPFSHDPRTIVRLWVG